MSTWIFLGFSGVREELKHCIFEKKRLKMKNQYRREKV
jgi:hypothetical protein